MSTTEKSGTPLVTLAGLTVAAVGVSHFAKPALWESLTAQAFPRDTRKHVYTNGGIETALGLGLALPKTRKLAIIAGIGYVTYLGGAVARSAR